MTPSSIEREMHAERTHVLLSFAANMTAVCERSQELLDRLDRKVSGLEQLVERRMEQSNGHYNR